MFHAGHRINHGTTLLNADNVKLRLTYIVSQLVMQKYFMASPFYRQERYQQLLGFPLKDSTQWNLVESVADCAYPVLSVLEQLAANGTHLNHDDTKVRILDIMHVNKLEPDKQRK